MSQDTVDTKNDDANVARDSLAAKTAPEAPSITTKKLKKLLLVILCSVIIVAGLAGGLYTLNNQKDTAKTTGNNKASCAPETDKQLLLRANPGIAELDYGILRPIVEEIKQINCYEQNTTYVYIALMAALSVSDSDNAEKMLATLKKIYDPSMGFDQRLVPYPASLENLTFQVEALKLAAQNLKLYDPLPIPEGE